MVTWPALYGIGRTNFIVLQSFSAEVSLNFWLVVKSSEQLICGRNILLEDPTKPGGRRYSVLFNCGDVTVIHRAVHFCFRRVLFPQKV